MAWLSDAGVCRKGVTASEWRPGTLEVQCWADGEHLCLNFEIPSKGGGKTDLMVMVGRQSVQEVLNTLATHMPGSALLMVRALQTARRTEEAQLAEVVKLSAELLSQIGRWQDYTYEQWRGSGTEAQLASARDVSDQVYDEAEDLQLALERLAQRSPEPGLEDAEVNPDEV